MDLDYNLARRIAQLKDNIKSLGDILKGVAGEIKDLVKE